MATTKNQTRYGIFYRSNGAWVGPYKGKTYTKYTLTRDPIKSDVQILKNDVLKSRIEVRPVAA